MLLLLSFLLSRKAGSCALPVLSPSFSQAPPHDPTSYITTTASTGACSGRSIWDILWSCLATTFACTWVSVHPNVPFLRESKKSTRNWRLYLMLLSLIAPEIMLLWAFKQLQGALMIMMTVNKAIIPEKDVAGQKIGENVQVTQTDKLDKKHEGKLSKTTPRWTLTHAHYLQMGGFRLQCTLEQGQKIGVRSEVGRIITAKYGPNTTDFWEVPLSFATLKNLFNSSTVDFPFVSKTEILDKCGKDSFSKTIAVLQLTWFILQIVARVCQNLAVTELELTTAALATLNIAMYISWWSKPNDILCPTIIQTRDLQEQIRSWKAEQHMHSLSVLMANSTFIIQQYPALPLNSDNPTPTTSSDGQPQYVMKKLEDNEKVNIVIHYGSEMMKALKSSMKVFTFPTTSVTALFSSFGQVLTAHFRSEHETNTREKPWYHHVLLAMAAVPVSIWWTVAHLFLALIYYPVLAILGSGGRLTRRSDTNNRRRVEDLSTINLIRSNTDLLLVMDMVFFCEESRSAPFFCLSAMSGAIFGMIHCLAWNFQFPSRVEQILWRTSSLILVGICVCMVAAAIVYSSSNTPGPRKARLKGAAELVRTVNRLKVSPTSKNKAFPPSANKSASPPSTDENASPPSANKNASPPSADENTSPPSANKNASPPSANKNASSPSANKNASPPSVDKNASPPSVDKNASPPSADKIVKHTSINLRRLFSWDINYWEVVCSAFAICFVLARLSLLALSIVGLRALPDSAFDIVQWSGFIPHI